MDSSLKAIVFDFDGVIIDSTSVKTEAFVDTYKDCGKEVQEYVRKYHEENQGCPRRAKIEHFASIINETSAEAIEKRVSLFAELAFTKVKQCPLFDGAKEALGELQKSYRLFVASATPHGELAETLERKGLVEFFETAWGFPMRKAEAIEEVRLRHQLSRDEVLMIGDSAADRDAAIEAGVNFLGVSFDGSQDPFPATCSVSQSFPDLIHAIETAGSDLNSTPASTT